MSYEVLEPFRRVRLTLDTHAFGAELEYESRFPAFDYDDCAGGNPLWILKPVAGVHGGHYEQAARCRAASRSARARTPARSPTCSPRWSSAGRPWPPCCPRRRGPALVNVSSLAGEFALRNIIPYCCSKAAITTATLALRRELHGTGVRAQLGLPTRPVSNEHR